ncbi:DnaJ domain-containing protein [Salinigranum sp. GCM10025319]|uniref:DnaJ domain-containing protein n=1 Tax=Salinigranum sp. GCM10025319 TaxID=3252687 RepID=UPI0036161690
MQAEDPYDVLGVNQDSDPTVVEAAYRALAKKHHPDRGGTQEQFRRIKSAYDEIQKRQSAEEDPRGNVSVSCTNCETTFSIQPEYVRKFGDEPFCSDCLVHTECATCGTGLRILHSKFNELGGNPVFCTNCGATESRSSWFWDGLSIGEKIVFPIAVCLLLFNLWLLMNGASDDILAFPALVVTGWVYLRGKRNTTA